MFARAARSAAVRTALAVTLICHSIVPVWGGSTWDVALALFATPDLAVAGDPVHLTLRATNLSGSVSDPIFDITTPAGTTFNSIATTSAQVFEAPAPGETGFIRCMVPGELEAGGDPIELEIIFNVTAEPDATIAFEALAFAGGLGDTDPTNNSATLDVDVVAPPSTVYDLAIGMLANPDPVLAGDLVTLTITVSNEGPDPAFDVTVELPTPASTTFDSIPTNVVVLEAPAPGESGPIRCLFPGQLDANEFVSLDVVFAVTGNPGDAIIFDAAATANLPQDDANETNNASSLVVDIVAPPTDIYDLAIDLSADPDPVQAGDLVTLTITVSNAGPNPAFDVTVELPTPEFTAFDSMPTAVTIVEAPAPGESGTIRCQFPGQLDAGRSVALDVVFAVTGAPGNTILFEAAATANAPDFDADPATNVASLAVQIPSDAVADVAVEILPVTDEAASRAPFAFAVAVMNRAMDGTAAAGVAVSIDVPLGTTFLSVSDVEGACVAPPPGERGTIICVVDELAADATASMDVEVLVMAPPGASIQLFARVATASADPDPSNDEGAATIGVVAGPNATLDWEEPDPSSTLDFPPPRNLVVLGDGERPGAMRGASTGILVKYNIYVSSQPGVAPRPGSQLTSVSPTVTTATVPAAPSGSFFVVTAVYEDGESGPSNEGSAEVPAATLSRVKVKSSKITANGTGFSDTVTVFVDGIPFVAAARVKAGNTKVVQRGTLLTGQTIGAYLAQHPNVLITFRNANGGIAAYHQPRP